MSGTVLVVGSINVDLVVSLARLPEPGETVAGGEFARHGGGKGANQAVAAARAGARVRFVGAVATTTSARPPSTRSPAKASRPARSRASKGRRPASR
jgi:ribokinase